MHRRLPLALLVFAATGCSPSLPAQQGEEWVEGEVIVKFRDGAEASRREAARSAIGTVQAARVPLVGAEELRLDGTITTTGALERLHEFADVVEYAEPNFLYREAGTPSDYDAGILWGLAKIDMPGAWADTLGSAEVVVAVVDSGVDVTHPDLAANIWRNTGETMNGMDDDGNGYVDDVRGWDFARGDSNPDDESFHGTHVAGTIAAVGGNGGVVGIAPNVKIMPLKTMSAGGGSTTAAIRAIDYARQNGADIINASWGSYGYSNALRDAIARAGQAGILFVAAAGNGDQYGRGMDAERSPMFPASYDLSSIVSVASTGPTDRLSSFSNYGALSVDLAAPGESIASTLPGEQYAYLDGTSMASPHVAGVAALLKSVQPNLTVSRMKDLLLENVDRVPALSGSVATGGRLDARKAVDAAIALGGGTGSGGGTTETPWTWESATGGSAHPYANGYDNTWVASQPGATEIRLRFSNLSTEAGYDFVILLDAAGNEVAVYDGNQGAFETVSVPGDTVYIRLVTDESITGYGFEVSNFGWR